MRLRSLAPFVAMVVATACGLSVEGTAVVVVDAGAPPIPTTSAPTTDATAPVQVDGATDCGASPTNARACGRCGRDCGGGECVAGACTAHVIADGITGAWYVAVDNERVYVTSHKFSGHGDGTVWAVPKAGGTKEKLTTLPDAFDILVTDDTIYVSSLDGMSLYSLPKAPPYTQKTVWTGGWTLDLHRRGTTVYFTTRGTNNESVYAIRPSAAPAALFTIDKGHEVEGVTSDGTHLYWANRAGAIGRVRLSDNDRYDNWESASKVRRLTIDDDAVYYTSDPSAYRQTKDGSTPTKLTDGMGLGTIVLDGPQAYITLYDAGRVVRLNKRDGTDSINIAKDLQQPTGLADDETSIYFSERIAGRLWRMTK